MKRIMTGFLLLMLSGIGAQAQDTYRIFNDNDSTSYNFRPDTSLVVSPSKLYYQTSVGLTEVYDFSVHFANADEFVRDFDVVSDQNWYAIVSRKSEFLGEALLLRSTDQGFSWSVDTTYRPTTRDLDQQGILNYTDELYTLQALTEDTLLLFVGYYNGSILYSTDAGVTWDQWFANQMVNYRGLLECEDDYYLWGFPGDGFRASMFSFPKSELLTPDVNGLWSNNAAQNHPRCQDGVNPDCTYPQPNIPLFDVYQFFRNRVDSLCPVLTSTQEQAETEPVRVYPNPAQGMVYVSVPSDVSGAHIRLVDAVGRTCLHQPVAPGQTEVDVSNLPEGWYVVVAESEGYQQVQKLMITR